MTGTPGNAGLEGVSGRVRFYVRPQGERLSCWPLTRQYVQRVAAPVPAVVSAAGRSSGCSRVPPGLPAGPPDSEGGTAQVPRQGGIDGSPVLGTAPARLAGAHGGRGRRRGGARAYPAAGGAP